MIHDIYLTAPTQEALGTDLAPLGLSAGGVPLSAGPRHALTTFSHVAGLGALLRCLDDALANTVEAAVFAAGTQIVDRPVGAPQFAGETSIPGAATEAAAGVVELATEAEGLDGTGTGAMTPPVTRAVLAAALSKQFTPGDIKLCAKNSIDEGWLECNGAAVSRTAYAELFAAIGTTFGSGDGSTTFNLPETRGEFIRGWAHTRGVDTGRVFGSSQGEAIINHVHGSGAQCYNTAGWNGSTYCLHWGTGSSQGTFNTGNPTSGGGTETRPRNIALMFCIKY